MEIKLPKPPIFSFKEILWFLDRKYDDCLYEVYPDEVRRCIEIQGRQAIISIKEDGDHLLVGLLTGKLATQEIEGYVTRWFDMNRNLEPFYSLMDTSELGYMTTGFNGLRMVGIPDLFEALCWCIIGQQINLTFAYTIKRRFVEAYGTNLRYQGEPYYTFPAPELLEKVSMQDLKDLQFSRQKADYILGLAESFRNGEISYESLVRLPLEEKRKRLLQLRGVGEWTANYVLMKTFGDTSSVPFGDVGLFKALENLGVIHDRKETKKIHRFFDRFPGWGSYLTIYLWRSLSNPEGV